MAERAPFIRKAAPAADEAGRAWPVVHAASLRYGMGKVAKVSRGALDQRTDADGNIEPYEADDPEVVRRLFGIELED